jgi:hypothetical protein
MDGMTLFGAGLIVGGLALLVIGIGTIRARVPAPEPQRPRDWSALDRQRRGLPSIQRSALLAKTVGLEEVQSPARVPLAAAPTEDLSAARRR